jgi:hypothetical protein
MWIIGHTAFTYLLIKGTRSLDKKGIEPRTLLFVFVFANIIDATHIGFGRQLWHNPLGTFLFSAGWILAFRYWGLIGKRDIPLLASAVLSHVLLDFLFGGYYFYYPFTDQMISVFPWDGVQDLMTESVLFVLFVAVLFLSKDWSRMTEYILREKDRFSRRYRLWRIHQPRFFPFYLYIVMTLFAFAQAVVYINKDQHELASLVWFYVLFMLVLISFALVLLSFLFPGDHSSRNAKGRGTRGDD